MTTMTLSSGQTLANYRITGSLGAGGMGEVWRATDTKLDREVALKVLPDDFADDPDRHARFEREAKVLASLNHPNIATLYGLENAEAATDSDSDPQASTSTRPPIHFLVMELVDGEDLSARIARGPISAEEAIPIAIQIAAALEVAHEHGIVHRDLKPANIKIAEDGTVKVLDFGLAKAWETHDGDSGLSLSPTLTRADTAAGVILGTASYMSPEQARGKRVDRRADIWSFGVVLWEMLTGQKLFDGDTVSDVLAAVLRAEPDLECASRHLTSSQKRVLARCLERDPRQRLQWIGDARIELASEDDARREPESDITGVRAGRRRGLVPWLIAFAAAAVAGATVMWSGLLTPDATAHRVAANITPPEGHRFEFNFGQSGSISVSPDGRWITFSATDEDGRNQLWLRPTGSLEARPIAGTEGASFPFWSPNSREIAFFADQKLQRVALDGSPAVTLCDAPSGRSGAWNSDGVILFSPSPTDPIYQVPAGGGEPVQATELDVELRETTHRWATFLPDERHFLFMAGSHADEIDGESHAIWVGDLDSRERHKIVHSRTNAAYAASHLLYTRGGVLLAQPFDEDRLEVTGDPTPLAEDVGTDLPYFRADFAVSNNGVMAYRLGDVHSSVQLHWTDFDGAIGEPLGEPARILQIKLAPDGTRAALTISDPESGTDDIWVHDLERDVRSRVTFGKLDEGSPTWSPDGTRIAFVAFRDVKSSELFVVQADGGTEPEFLYSSPNDLAPFAWTPDGEYLLFNSTTTDSDRNTDILALPLSGGDPTPILATPLDEFGTDVSPDGRWMLYVSEVSNRRVAFATSFPDAERRWQVTNEATLGAVWRRPDEIFFVTAPESQRNTVSVRAVGDGLQIGLSQLRGSVPNSVTGDLAPDGRRTLVTIQPEHTEQLPIILIANWPEMLGDR